MFFLRRTSSPGIATNLNLIIACSDEHQTLKDRYLSLIDFSSSCQTSTTPMLAGLRERNGEVTAYQVDPGTVGITDIRVTISATTEPISHRVHIDHPQVEKLPPANSRNSQGGAVGVIYRANFTSAYLDSIPFTRSDP